MVPPADDDNFTPAPTEILPHGSDDASFDPQATERLEAPSGLTSNRSASESPADAEPVNAETSSPPAGSGDQLSGAQDPEATVLMGREALGLDPSPSLDDLSASKFLGGAAEAASDPFGATNEDVGPQLSCNPTDSVPDDRSPPSLPEATGHWEGVAAIAPVSSNESATANNRHDARSVPVHPSADRARRKLTRWLLVLIAAGGSAVVGWLSLTSAPQVTAHVTRVPEPTAPPPDNDPPIDDEETVDPADADQVLAPKYRKRRTPRKRSRIKKMRSRSPAAKKVAAVTSGPSSMMGLGKLRDVSGAGIRSLQPTLVNSLKRQLKKHRGVQLLGKRPRKGYVVDAWVQNVRKRKADQGNMVEVSCSAALSEQPGGGVKFNTRATTGVGVSEQLTRPLIEELANDALIRCISELASDIGRYGARKGG